MRWAIFLATAVLMASLAASGLPVLSSVSLASPENSVAPPRPAKARETLPQPPAPQPPAENGEVVRETVTHFLWVKHQDGYVVTGIVAPDGQGDMILQTYCYFYQPTTERIGRVVDLVVDGVRLPNLTAEIVPMPEEAIKKCRSSGKVPASSGGASR